MRSFLLSSMLTYGCSVLFFPVENLGEEKASHHPANVAQVTWACRHLKDQTCRRKAQGNSLLLQLPTKGAGFIAHELHSLSGRSLTH